MQAIHTHPVNAEQATAFTAYGSLSFPTAQQELSQLATQPSMSPPQAPTQDNNGTAVVATTASATMPGTVGNQGPSGITPTLQ
jgi:hypothetical protein